MNTIEVFSGVGGIMYALKGIVKPVLYCEIDKNAQEVLKARMADGKLPKAPICPDVRKLDKTWVRGKVDMIAGGFPCTGMSAIGKLQGLKDPQSGLFREIVRLVDVFHPNLVFLENVPGVVRMSLPVIQGVFKKRGYNFRWCVVSASNFGATHKRNRWFGLAVKKEVKVPLLYKPIARWGGTEPPRMTLHQEPSRTARCGMMGNAVVPDCVRWAFLHLVNNLTDDPPNKARDSKLCFDPLLFKTSTPPSPTITTGRLLKPVHSKFWSTPRYTQTSGSQYITNRTWRDLPTQLRFEKSTPHHLRKGHMNPDFLEYLMGFPVGWTKLTNGPQPTK